MKEIELISFVIRSNKDITIKNKYTILFTNWNSGTTQYVEYILYFNKNNVIFHNHSPVSLKKYSTSGMNKFQRNNTFSIWCNDCKCYFDL